jgi:hypothetical protein
MSIRFTIIRRRRITTEADVDASQRGWMSIFWFISPQLCWYSSEKCINTVLILQMRKLRIRDLP